MDKVLQTVLNRLYYFIIIIKLGLNGFTFGLSAACTSLYLLSLEHCIEPVS